MFHSSLRISASDCSTIVLSDWRATGILPHGKGKRDYEIQFLWFSFSLNPQTLSVPCNTCIFDKACKRTLRSSPSLIQSGTFRVTLYGRRLAAHRAFVTKNHQLRLRAARPRVADRPARDWPPAGRIVMIP
jgi:hypothetical protein